MSADCWKRIWVLSTALTLFGVAATRTEATPPLEVAVEEDGLARDWRLTVEARRVLFEDVVLSDLNLGVSVRAGVATVWGAAPDEVLVSRALSKVRQVRGINDVRSEVTIERNGDAPRGVDGPRRQPFSVLSEPEFRSVLSRPASVALTSRPSVIVKSSKTNATTLSPLANPLRPAVEARGPSAILLPLEPEPMGN